MDEQDAPKHPLPVSSFILDSSKEDLKPFRDCELLRQNELVHSEARFVNKMLELQATPEPPLSPDDIMER